VGDGGGTLAAPVGDAGPEVRGVPDADGARVVDAGPAPDGEGVVEVGDGASSAPCDPQPAASPAAASATQSPAPTKRIPGQ
jgi:hypothetical protein